MTPALNSHQLRSLDRIVFECGALDVNLVVQQLIGRHVLGGYYCNLMGPNTVSSQQRGWSRQPLQPAMRTSKMFEVVNVVKKLGVDAYVSLFETIAGVGGAQCAAAVELAVSLPAE